MSTVGPFSTERQAHAAALELGGRGRGPQFILSTAENREMLTEACKAAGVEPGTFDARILAWLAGYEDSACAVVAGLVGRAYAAGRASQGEQR